MVPIRTPTSREPSAPLVCAPGFLIFPVSCLLAANSLPLCTLSPVCRRFPHTSKCCFVCFLFPVGHRRGHPFSTLSHFFVFSRLSWVVFLVASWKFSHAFSRFCFPLENLCVCFLTNWPLFRPVRADLRTVGPVFVYYLKRHQRCWTPLLFCCCSMRP